MCVVCTNPFFRTLCNLFTDEYEVRGNRYTLVVVVELTDKDKGKVKALVKRKTRDLKKARTKKTKRKKRQAKVVTRIFY